MEWDEASPALHGRICAYWCWEGTVIGQFGVLCVLRIRAGSFETDMFSLAQYIHNGLRLLQLSSGYELSTHLGTVGTLCNELVYHPDWNPFSA